MIILRRIIAVLIGGILFVMFWGGFLVAEQDAPLAHRIHEGKR